MTGLQTFVLGGCLGLASVAVQPGTTAYASAQSSAALDCRIVMDLSTARWSIANYDPYDTDAPFQQFQVTLTNEGGGECSGTLQAELDGETFGLKGVSPIPLPYSLTDEEAGLDLTPRAGRTLRTASQRPIRLAAGETATKFVKFAVDTRRLEGDGAFLQRLRLEIVDEAMNSLAGRTLSLELSVNPSISINLAGALARRAAATIDLGELSQGVHDSPVQVQVRSTRGYTVSVSSQNAGRLRLEQSAWTIPYVLLIGEDQMNLTEPSGFSAGASGNRSDNYPIAVEVGDVSDKRAGKYSDVITIEVAPL